MNRHQALADLIGGTPIGPNVIAVGNLRVNIYPAGGVYLARNLDEPRGQKLGTVSMGAEALAEEFAEAVRERESEEMAS